MSSDTQKVLKITLEVLESDFEHFLVSDLIKMT